MADEIRPALKPHEWHSPVYGENYPPQVKREINGHFVRMHADTQDGVVDVHIGYTDDDEYDVYLPLPPAETMALANAALPDGDPRKLTQSDVDELWRAREWLDTEEGEHWETLAALARIAAKLAVFLPPRPV